MAHITPLYPHGVLSSAQSPTMTERQSSGRMIGRARRRSIQPGSFKPCNTGREEVNLPRSGLDVASDNEDTIKL